MMSSLFFEKSLFYLYFWDPQYPPPGGGVPPTMGQWVSAPAPPPPAPGAYTETSSKVCSTSDCPADPPSSLLPHRDTNMPTPYPQYIPDCSPMTYRGREIFAWKSCIISMVMEEYKNFPPPLVDLLIKKLLQY